MEQLHVAGIRRAAIEDLGGPRNTPHDLGQWRIIEIAEVGARLIVSEPGQEQVPEALFARRLLQRLEQRNRMPPGIGFTMKRPILRNHTFVHERLQRAA